MEPALNNRYESTKYNGHDYRSTKYAGPLNIDIGALDEPNTNVAVVIDSSESISNNKLETVKATVSHLKNEIYKLNNKINFDVIAFGRDDAGTSGPIRVNDRINSIERIKIDSLYLGIRGARDVLSSESVNATKVLIIFSDGASNDIDKIQEQIRLALSDDIRVIVVNIDSLNSNVFNVWAAITDRATQEISEIKTIIYQNLVDVVDNNYYTANNLFNLVVKSIRNDKMELDRKSYALDYLKNESIYTDGAIKNVTGRAEVMEYSQKMFYENSDVLNIDALNQMMGLDRNSVSDKVKKLADVTKMTADSDVVKISFSDNINESAQINLGLHKIPESHFKVINEVDNIIITLSDNSKIINLKEQMTQNVQTIPNSLYSIYLDNEIMQGAKVEVIYKMTIENIGSSDTLWPYLQGYEREYEQLYGKNSSEFLELEKSFYNKLHRGYNGDELNISDDQINELINKVIPFRIARLFDYHDNLTFRPEENNNLPIEIYYKMIESIDSENNNNIIYKDGKVNLSADLRRTQWNKVEIDIAANNTIDAVGTELKDSSNIFSVIETSSLKDIELYPEEYAEKNVKELDNLELNDIIPHKVVTYLKLSKTISAEDTDKEDSLRYRNYVEINRSESLTGRRDETGVLGNYKPAEKFYKYQGLNKFMDQPMQMRKQSDVAAAPEIIIIPPFGLNKINFGLVTLVVIGLGIGIYTVRRKLIILNKKKNIKKK